jgi:hypothetical protein
MVTRDRPRGPRDHDAFDEVHDERTKKRRSHRTSRDTGELARRVRPICGESKLD